MRPHSLVARILASLWTSAVLAAAINGCSSGGTGGTGSTGCDAVVATLCEKACSSCGDGTCRFLFPTSPDGGTLSPDTSNGSSDGCNLLYLDFCTHSADQANLAACQSALDAAPCMPLGDGSGAQGVVVPDACVPLL